MSKSAHEVLKALAWPTYFVAILLIVTPALDFAANVLPIRPSDVNWRYGSVGLLAGFLLTPLFGIMFALGAAAVLEHRLVLRVLSSLNVVVAVLLIFLIVFFALDALQVRAAIPGDAPTETRSMFGIGAAKATIKYFTMAVCLGWLGIAGLRVTRRRKGERPLKPKRGAVPLVRAADEDELSTSEDSAGK